MLQKTTKNYKKLQKTTKNHWKTKFSKNGPKKITVYFKIKTTLKLISYHAKKQFPDPKLPTKSAVPSDWSVAPFSGSFGPCGES